MPRAGSAAAVAAPAARGTATDLGPPPPARTRTPRDSRRRRGEGLPHPAAPVCASAWPGGRGRARPPGAAVTCVGVWGVCRWSEVGEVVGESESLSLVGLILLLKRNLVIKLQPSGFRRLPTGTSAGCVCMCVGMCVGWGRGGSTVCTPWAPWPLDCGAAGGGQVRGS